MRLFDPFTEELVRDLDLRPHIVNAQQAHRREPSVKVHFCDSGLNMSQSFFPDRTTRHTLLKSPIIHSFTNSCGYYFPIISIA